MKKFSILLAVINLSLSAAATTTFVFESADAVSQSADGISVALDKGTGNNFPAYYENGMRMYANQTITVSGANLTAIQIVFAKQGTKGYASLAASEGNLVSGGESTSAEDLKTDFWIGNTSSVVFTLGTTGQRVIKKIIVNSTQIIYGECGPDLKWILAKEDSTLSFFGSGAMTSHPWAEYNSNIAQVSFHEGITSIDELAFSGCNSLTSVTIPNTVTLIGNYAFSDCSKLTSVTISNNITSIDEYVFRNCYNLATIDIPNSVTNIGIGAFWGCGGLNSIDIPQSVTNISINAFDYCRNLTSINVSQGNSAYSSLDGVLFNDDKTALIKYPLAKQGEYIIPNSVITIGDYAFLSCSALTSVIIPNSVTAIREWAFSGCSKLQNVEISDNIKNIGAYAFNFCSGVTSITCKSITPPILGNNAFRMINKSTCNLYVPKKSVDLYTVSDGWKEFLVIMGIDDSEDPIETLEGNYTIYYEGKDSQELTNEVVTLHVPEAPVIEGFTFVSWDVLPGHLIDGIILQAIYTANTPTSAPAVYTNPANPAQKLIKNGNVYILNEDKKYTIMGQTVQ